MHSRILTSVMRRHHIVYQFLAEVCKITIKVHLTMILQMRSSIFICYTRYLIIKDARLISDVSITDSIQMACKNTPLLQFECIGLTTPTSGFNILWIDHKKVPNEVPKFLLVNFK